jgi:hypothetical protein
VLGKIYWKNLKTKPEQEYNVENHKTMIKKQTIV